MSKQIKLGYEMETGEEVGITPSHIIVAGVTQLSGKTTTLEALIRRSKKKAIVFKTKVGEKSFSEGTEVKPYFKDRSDYEFVKSLIEAYSRDKMSIEKGTLMELCKGTKSLIQIKEKVDEKLDTGKLRGITKEIHIRLQHYLEQLIPQIRMEDLSSVLTVHQGINIMNLERFTGEAQSLIISSVLEEVLAKMKGIIIVVPEAWKFIPQRYNNPCKRGVESFIRQGATNKNFIWIDSQDMAGVDKIPLKQVSTWILGYQSERNEVKHTIDQIPLPKKSKPTPDDIMNLKKGQFYLSGSLGVRKVYVQPYWLSDVDAKNIALGELDVETVVKPETLSNKLITPQAKETDKTKVESPFIRKLKTDLTELRVDFFKKAEEIQNNMRQIATQVYVLENKKTELNEEELIGKVLQKIPTSSSPNIDINTIVDLVIPKIPKMAGSVTYEIAPLEKLKKDFQEEAKNKIFADVKTLTPNHHKIIKYVESQNKGVGQKDLISKCFFLVVHGSSRSKISKLCGETEQLGLLRKDKRGVVFPRLKQRISELILHHGATEQEISDVYDHIIMEMIN
ncbi:MAG: hypothetical protein V3U92_19560 [Cellulophaga sp.]